MSSSSKSSFLSHPFSPLRLVQNRNPFDFFKIKDLDKKEDRYDENVSSLFEENGLYRKKLPKVPPILLLTSPNLLRVLIPL